MFTKSMSPFVIAFLLIGSCIFIFRKFLQQHDLDWQVLSGGHLFIYIITIASLHLLSSGLRADNTQAFLRKAYSGILLKLFACAAAAFVYILAAGQNFSKYTLFACMGLYLVYSFIEIKVILEQSKPKKNG